MFVIVAEFKITPDKVEEFARLIDRQARDSLKHEKDCHYFDVCQDEKDPSLFLLYEMYTTAAAFDAHREYAYTKAFHSAVKPMVMEVKAHRLSRRAPLA